MRGHPALTYRELAERMAASSDVPLVEDSDVPPGSVWYYPIRYEGRDPGVYVNPEALDLEIGAFKTKAGWDNWAK